MPRREPTLKNPIISFINKKSLCRMCDRGTSC